MIREADGDDVPRIRALMEKQAWFLAAALVRCNACKSHCCRQRLGARLGIRVQDLGLYMRF
jgi:hypothetical protein